MKNQEILDDELLEKKDIPRNEIIQWWEKKRILYNIFLFGIEILIMLFYWQETILFGIPLAVFLTLMVNFIANIFYNAGSTLEIFISKYLKQTMPPAFKKVFFALGTLFSLTLAFIAYVSELSGLTIFHF